MADATQPDADGFDRFAASVCDPVPGIDRVSIHVVAEHSDFVRFNHARVRQATRVVQHQVTLTVARGRRRLSSQFNVADIGPSAVPIAHAERDRLVALIDDVPDDPLAAEPPPLQQTHRDDVSPSSADARHRTAGPKHVASDAVRSGADASGAGQAGATSSSRAPMSATVAADVIAAVRSHASDLDLVGMLASGPSIRAFADSRGQRNWHRVDNHVFDWCLYDRTDPSIRDRAVKSQLAGTGAFDVSRFAHRVALAHGRLALLGTPPRRLEPGRYRVLFEPAAVAELLSALAWGGFGAKDVRSGTSSLKALHDGTATMDERIDLVEDLQSGIAPAFTADGLVLPKRIALITAGRADQLLASPRSSCEFGLACNAGDDESPQSLALAPGRLPPADALAALGDGIWVSNLWYLNYSDRLATRLTGMTRFASFVVEKGRIVAPIVPMRFDDSALRMFGSGLEALGDAQEWLPDTDTWGHRQLGSVRCPSVLVRDVDFTL